MEDARARERRAPARQLLTGQKKAKPEAAELGLGVPGDAQAILLKLQPQRRLNSRNSLEIAVPMQQWLTQFNARSRDQAIVGAANGDTSPAATRVKPGGVLQRFAQDFLESAA